MGTTTSTTQGADAIFGVTNPGGKLLVMLPRHVGQEPIHHAHTWESGYQRTRVDVHEGYLDMPSAPHYGALELERENVDVGGEARASLAVTNTGGRHGTAVVQLYDADTGTGVTLPALQRWIRPGRPRAGCIEVGELRRPDGSARLHGTLRRVRQRARSGGANRGQQLERDPIQRHVR